MTRAYELALVLNPELSDAEIERLVTSLKTTIEKSGGEIIGEDSWGRKETAYKLKGNREAFYLFLDVELDPAKVLMVEQTVRLTDNVLRHLVTLKEETTEERS